MTETTTASPWLAVAAICVYLLPIFIAAVRGHRNTVAIAVLTVLGGWTVAGWLIAIVWSAIALSPRRA